MANRTIERWGFRNAWARQIKSWDERTLEFLNFKDGVVEYGHSSTKQQ